MSAQTACSVLRFYTATNAELLYLARYADVERAEDGVRFYNRIFDTQVFLPCPDSVAVSLMALLGKGVSYAELTYFFKTQLPGCPVTPAQLISLAALE